VYCTTAIRVEPDVYVKTDLLYFVKNGIKFMWGTTWGHRPTTFWPRAIAPMESAPMADGLGWVGLD